MSIQFHKPTSIVIPSLNSPIIDRVVEAVLKQDGFTLDDEIIIIGKDDLGLLVAQKGVQFIDTGNPVDASTARNIGFDSATGELLIFLDSDCLPQKDWLEQHRQAHALGHEVVSGSVLPIGNNYWHLTYNLSMFHELFPTAEVGSRPFLPTLNLSIDRYVIEQVGGLDASLPYSHDLDWTARMREAGFTPYFWPGAAVRHEHNRNSMQDVWRDCVINGHYARQSRLRHQATLGTPAFLQNRKMVVLLSPAIAFWITGKIFNGRRETMGRNLATIPAIYLTKLAWCWGAGH